MQKIGLALGAGAARGFAHIGVIKKLESENIPIHCISGCSMGSIVGGLYARGMEIDMIEGLATNLDHRKWMDVGVPRKGLLRGKKILELLRFLLRDYNFEDLHLPFACLAADIQNGMEVVIKDGDVAKAIRASISIPGIFVPWVDEKGRVLVDGAVLKRVPIKACKELGAHKVIAVDVDFQIEDVKVDTIFDVILQSMSIMQKEIMNYKLTGGDLIIKPNVNKIKPGQFERADEAIQIGEEACSEVIEDLKALVK